VYELRQPAVALQAYIEHYWFVRTTAHQPADLRVDVFVDARADLIFNFGAPYLRSEIGGATDVLAVSNVDAQRLVPIRIEQRGAVRTTGVRFRLGGLAPFARVALAPLTGRTVAPELVFGSDTTGLERALEQLDELDAQAAALDGFFLGALARAPALARFHRALELAIRTHGGASVADLAATTGVSTRHVERLFAQHLGVAPKPLSRVLRFQRALTALMRAPGESLAAIAADAGYFDQAHFVREFRRWTGGVPRGYRGYFPAEAPTDFAPNVVAFVQAAPAVAPVEPADSGRSRPAPRRKDPR